MRKLKKGMLLLVLCLGLLPLRVEAAEGNGAKAEEATYLQAYRDELDFSGLDEFLEEDLFQKQRSPLRFSAVVDALMRDGWKHFDYTMVVAWIVDVLFYELQENRRILVEVVVLAVAFSALRNFSGAFKQVYVAEISFFFVYGVLAVLLLQSFRNYGAIVGEALTRSVEFMKVLVPTFCVSMVFSTGAGTSASFYQLAFLVIYLIQWLFLKVLLPLVHVYVLLVLFNYFWEDEKFENLTELLKSLINWGLKSAGVLVIGMNVVQGLLAPAKDRLMSATVQRAAAMIPGVGNVVNGIGELLLGSGILIKNCVGVTALLFLVFIGMLPVLKLLCLSFFYKLAAVAVEPVADKRIVGCLKGMAEGGMLCLRLIIYCIVLLFVTIALTTAASGLVA